MTMPAQPPAPPAPTAPDQLEPGTPGTITVPAPPPGAFDPRTGEPIAQPVGAPDPNGVWGAGVLPATPPAAGGVVAPPAVPQAAPVPTGYAPGAGTPIQPVVVGGVQYFTAEALEEARRQEREKLYGRLEEQSQKLNTVTEFVEQQRQREAQLMQEAAEAAERERQAALTAEQRVAESLQRLEASNQELAQQIAMRDAIFVREQELQKVAEFRTKRLSEEGDLIHPSLHYTVQGATNEEIEQSIVAAKAATDAMVQDMQGQQALRPGVPPSTVRMVAPTGAPPADPSVNTSGQQTFSAQDIAQMDNATYAKHRASLMQAVSERARTGRLYQP